MAGELINYEYDLVDKVPNQRVCIPVFECSCGWPTLAPVSGLYTIACPACGKLNLIEVSNGNE